MNDICVGDYIRTKDGEIGKVRVIIDEKIFINENQYYSANITKHSKDIIDLIEVDDIILYNSNYLGRKVKLEVNYSCKKANDYKWGEGYVDTVIDEYIMIDDIKSVVTHEQFSSMQYIVKED